MLIEGRTYYPDTKKTCYCSLLLTFTDDFTQYITLEGAVFKWDESKSLDQSRFHCYQAWAKVAGIWGIRIQPPDCVLALITERYGHSQKGYQAKENRCKCSTCKSARVMLSPDLNISPPAKKPRLLQHCKLPDSDSD